MTRNVDSSQTRKSDFFIRKIFINVFLVRFDKIIYICIYIRLTSFLIFFIICLFSVFFCTSRLFSPLFPSYVRIHKNIFLFSPSLCLAQSSSMPPSCVVETITVDLLGKRHPTLRLQSSLLTLRFFVDQPI